MQKTALKNNELSKNEAILKIHKNGQYAKAIAFAKSLSLGQKLKLQKKCQKRLLNPITGVLCKKRL